MQTLSAIAHVIVLAGIAPFLGGLITRIKNNLRMRKGQSVLQPYYNIAKLFRKGEVVSETASWIFRAAPFVAVASSLAAVILVSARAPAGGSAPFGDFLALIFIFALGRFFLALAALDTGSAFGGMGSSREMFISGLVEPALILVVFSQSLRYGTTALAALGSAPVVTVSSFAAALALLLLTLAETSRVPVDNQETHLELTMVHEAMVLEYSGRSLALLEIAASLKQTVFFVLIAEIALPVAAAGFAGRTVTIVTRLAVISAVVAAIEVSVAKMRLFRVADYLMFAFVLGIVAVVCAILGV